MCALIKSLGRSVKPSKTASVRWTALPEGRSPSKKKQGDEGRLKMVSKGANKKSSPSKRDVSEVRRLGRALARSWQRIESATTAMHCSDGKLVPCFGVTLSALKSGCEAIPHSGSVWLGSVGKQQ